MPDHRQLVLRHLPVQRLSVDRLGQQFTQMAAHVLDHAALRLDLAAEIPAGIAVDVDERLQADAELAAVTEDHSVRGRKARWASVEILAGRNVATWSGRPFWTMRSPPRMVHARPPIRSRASSTVT